MTQENLLALIYKLPKEIRDHIYSYNIEHRIMMKNVIFDIDYVKCDNCNNYIRLTNTISSHIYKNYSNLPIKFNNYIKFCSTWCSINHKTSMVTLRRNKKLKP